MEESRNASDVPQPEPGIKRQTTEEASREAWGRVMGDDQPSPVEYETTSVLLLGWAENADDTRTAEDLVPLQEVLQESYGFTVQYQRMDMQSHPQVQATKHVAEFVLQNDESRGLLIVYYGGHGWAYKNSDGRIWLSGRYPDLDHEKDMSIAWTEVEHTLSKAKSDVLVIFDCCHAGLLCRPVYRGRGRSFSYVAACKRDQQTHSSGEKSFTTAMIWALKDLAHSSGFTVTRLVKTLMSYEPFPRDQQEAVVYPSRFGEGTQDIWITPTMGKRTELPAQAKVPSSKHVDVMPTAYILDLRLHFRKHAPPEHIEEVATVLKELLDTRKCLHFHRITFLEYTSFIKWSVGRWLTYRKGQAAKDSSRTPNEQQPASSDSEPFNASFESRLLQPPILRTGDNTLDSAVSKTSIASPLGNSRETETMLGRLPVSSGQLIIYPKVPLGVLFGCVALFGVCCGGTIGLTWAFSGPRIWHMGEAMV